MKPKIHSRFSPRCAQGPTPISIHTSIGLFATIGLIGLSAQNASGQTAYTIKPSATTLNWNQGYVPEVIEPPTPAVPSSWTPEAVPGAYPGTVAGDSALVTGAFGGVAQTVDISATLTNPLVALTLGDTTGTGTTTIQTSNTTSLALNAATIIAQGPLVAPANVNIISAPITLTGGLTIGVVPTPVLPDVATTSNTNLTISGKITPSAAAARTIINSSGKTLELGDIDISTAATTAVLTFRNENNLATNRINLHGVIANGSSVAAGVIFDGRFNGAGANVFEIGNNSLLNTFTGTCILQSNGAGGRPATFLINSNQPFGTGAGGKLTIGQASGSTTILEALNSARTIPNPTVDMLRNNNFQGANSITFSGTITTGSSHIVTNDMFGTGQLVFGGRYNLDNSANTALAPIVGTSDSRMRPFGGTGVTVFNGLLADHAIPTADMFGGINVTGAGTAIINGTATFQGDARVTGAGTLQLGNGGITGIITPDFPNLSYADFSIIAGVATTNAPLTFPAFVKKSVVTGGSTGTGSLAVKHSDDIALSSTLNGGIGLKQIGSGVLTVATPQFNSGANQVGDGVSASKLVVNGGLVNETTQNGDFSAPVVHATGYNTFYQIVSNLTDTSTLSIGQPVYLSAASGAIYIHSIDSATQVTLMGTGVTNGITGLTPTGVAQPIFFGAGSGLGTSAATTSVKALSTLGGTGIIAGAVTVDGTLAPGASVGTLATGALTFSAGSTLAVEINTSTTTADKVLVTGGVSTGASTVNLTLTDLGSNVALADGTKLILVDYTTTWPGTDVLTYGGNPVADNSTITLGANTFTVKYADATEGGTALTLTAVAGGGGGGYASWASIHAGSQTANLDYDNDGTSNGIEYFMNAAAGFTANPGAVGGTVTWINGGNIPSSAYGTQFVVQTSTNLVNWTPVSSGDPNLSNTSGSVSYTPPTGAATSFTRLVVTPD